MAALRIGLYGGSFDPIHNGHIQVANLIYSTLKLDKLYFIPSYQSLDHKLFHASSTERFNMCKLAASEYSGFDVSNFEINQHKAVYTKDTLAHFQALNPDSKLFWLMGADQAIQLNTWHNLEAILKLSTIVIYPRDSLSMSDNMSIDGQVYTVATEPKDFAHAKIIFLHDQPLHQSASSDIKRHWNDTAFIENHINKNILAYIKTHKLYKE